MTKSKFIGRKQKNFYYLTDRNHVDEQHPNAPQVTDGRNEGDGGQAVADEEPEVGPCLVAHLRIQN